MRHLAQGGQTVGNVKKKLKMYFISLIAGALPLIIICALVYGGITSAFNFFSGASETGQIDVEACTLPELIAAVKDKSLFTDDMVESTMLDRTSLLRLLEAVNDYNNAALEKSLGIQHTKSWSEKKSRRVARSYIDIDGSYVTRWVTQYYIANKTAKEKVEVIVNNRWVRERYPIDWQIVYLFCLFHSMDAEDDMDLGEDGETIRLKQSFVDEVVGAVACEETWAANAVSYSWGWGSITPDEVCHEYGQGKLGSYYTTNKFFVPDSSIYSGGYSYSGYVPLSYLDSVQGLTFIDAYPGGAIGNKDKRTTAYDSSKLLGLIEKYGNGRDLNCFLAALQELPQGIRIADKLVYDLERGGYEY